MCQDLKLAMKIEGAKGNAFNVGTGIPITINSIAQILAQKINPKLKPVITNKYRAGDIRHCFADISKFKEKSGFEPKTSFKQGIEELIQWVKLQVGKVQDKSRNAFEELENKGLI